MKNHVLRTIGIIISFYLVYKLFKVENILVTIFTLIYIFSIIYIHFYKLIYSFFGIYGDERIKNYSKSSYEKKWKINNKYELILFTAIPLIALNRDYIYSFILGFTDLCNNGWKKYPKKT